MKKISKSAAFLLLMMACSAPAAAQFNLGKAASGALKAGKAMTLTDAQMAQYVKESIDWMDKNNRVCTADDPQTKQYVERLNKLVEGLDEVEGIPLNFKVYYVVDVNAFACPDGSVRVFSSLMDIMTDDELLGVIGHELGHVALKHSKKAYRTALLTSALKDGIASTGGKAAALTDSQLGQLGEAVLNSQFSQKEESQADDYGYDFLKKKGKNPWSIALSFEKLQQLENGAEKGSKMERLLSSHPDTSKRIQKMSDRAKADGIARPDNK